jgi:lysophospholipase L1-like esterase
MAENYSQLLQILGVNDSLFKQYDASVLGQTKYGRVARLLTISTAADRGNNPYQRPVSPSAPTITVSASSNASLTAYFFASANVLTSTAQTQMSWYGGVPVGINGVYIAMPVASVSPNTAGNIGGTQGANNSWSAAFEFETDATSVQPILFTDNAKKIMFQVDGQYVDFTGTTGSGAAADYCFQLTFGTSAIRRIRVMWSTNPATGPVLPKAIRLTPLASMWQPSQKDVVRVGWIGDSYMQGTNGAATIYPIPNAAWPVLTSELLGFRDCRQLAVGGTGWLANNGGLFSKLRDQIPFWATTQAPFDLFVVGAGYNDTPPTFTAAAITAEVQTYLTTLRTQFPNVPVIVLGCQAGSGGPSANQIACENAILAGVNNYLAATADPICKFAPVSTDTPTWFNGTGKVGATNASGNSDTYVDADATHPTVLGAQYLAHRTARAVRLALQAMIGN